MYGDKLRKEEDSSFRRKRLSVIGGNIIVNPDTSKSSVSIYKKWKKKSKSKGGIKWDEDNLDLNKSLLLEIRGQEAAAPVEIIIVEETTNQLNALGVLNPPTEVLRQVSKTESLRSTDSRREEFKSRARQDIRGEFLHKREENDLVGNNNSLAFNNGDMILDDTSESPSPPQSPSPISPQLASIGFASSKYTHEISDEFLKNDSEIIKRLQTTAHDSGRSMSRFALSSIEVKAHHLLGKIDRSISSPTGVRYNPFGLSESRSSSTENELGNIPQGTDHKNEREELAELDQNHILKPRRVVSPEFGGYAQVEQSFIFDHTNTNQNGGLPSSPPILTPSEMHNHEMNISFNFVNNSVKDTTKKHVKSGTVNNNNQNDSEDLEDWLIHNLKRVASAGSNNHTAPITSFPDTQPIPPSFTRFKPTDIQLNESFSPVSHGSKLQQVNLASPSLGSEYLGRGAVHRDSLSNGAKVCNGGATLPVEESLFAFGILKQGTSQMGASPDGVFGGVSSTTRTAGYPNHAVASIPLHGNFDQNNKSTSPSANLLSGEGLDGGAVKTGEGAQFLDHEGTQNRHYNIDIINDNLPLDRVSIDDDKKKKLLGSKENQMLVLHNNFKNSLHSKDKENKEGKSLIDASDDDASVHRDEVTVSGIDPLERGVSFFDANLPESALVSSSGCEREMGFNFQANTESNLGDQFDIDGLRRQQSTKSAGAKTPPGSQTGSVLQSTGRTSYVKAIDNAASSKRTLDALLCRGGSQQQQQQQHVHSFPSLNKNVKFESSVGWQAPHGVNTGSQASKTQWASRSENCPSLFCLQ